VPPVARLPHPAVTTDVVVFTIHEQQLKVLLVRRGHAPFEGWWALPGGAVHLDEDLEASAQRLLAERTGLTGVYLEQLYTFGDPRRDPRERVVSVTYYALVPCERLAPEPQSDVEAVGWFALDALPPLAFDHGEMVAVARERLAAKLTYSTIAFQFMAEQFTLSELQAVYEIILDQPLDKRNFRKRVLALEQIEATGEARRDGKHRPARLYRAKNPGEVQIIR